jgi:hypothetical protein
MTIRLAGAGGDRSAGASRSSERVVVATVGAGRDALPVTVQSIRPRRVGAARKTVTP